MKRKVTVCIIFLVVMMGSMMIGLGSYEISRSLSHDMDEARELRLRMAWNALTQQSNSFHLQDGKLFAGETLLNENDALVEEIAQQVRGAVTIFQGETRIATTIRLPDGSRAIGTQWLLGLEKEAVFRKNGEYRGEASIFGEPYWIASRPIRDLEGKIIGALQIAARKSNSFAALMRAVRNSLLVMASGALMIGSVVYAALHSLIQELYRMALRRQLILESTGEGIYGLDREGRCTFINQTGAKLLGYRPRELVGREMHPLMHYRHSHGSPYSIQNCTLCRAFSFKKVCRQDEVFWHKDGSAIPIRYVSSPIVDRGIVRGAIVAFNEISEPRESPMGFLSQNATEKIRADSAEANLERV